MHFRNAYMAQLEVTVSIDGRRVEHRYMHYFIMLYHIFRDLEIYSKFGIHSTSQEIVKLAKPYMSEKVTFL